VRSCASSQAYSYSFHATEEASRLAASIMAAMLRLRVQKLPMMSAVSYSVDL
jgi:hypothetical protein